MYRLEGKLLFSVLAVFAMLVVFALFALWQPGDDALQVDGDDQVPGRVLTLRYSFELVNRTSEVVSDIQFETFAPVKLTPFQRVDWITASRDFDVVVDAVGNQRLLFQFSQLPPFGRSEITVTAQVTMTSDANVNVPWHPEDFLRVEPFIEHDDPLVHGLVARLNGMTSTTTQIDWLRQANRWVAATLEDTGYLALDKGALYALTHRRGDCTEFMYALVALARANGIPAVPIAGFRVSTDASVLRAADYHNWLNFNAEHTWGLADPHAGLFESQQTDYVAFHVVQPSNRSDERDTAQRFFVYDPRITASLH